MRTAKTCNTTAALFVLIWCLSSTLGWTAEHDWQIAEPSEVGLDPAPLNTLATRIRANPEINIHSLLIVKDGKLVFEEYFTGHDQDWGTDLGVVEFDKDRLHDLRSVSKSVTSALVGIAISEGKIPGVEATAHDLFPEYLEHMAPDKRSMTLQHILTMSAGLDWFEPSDYTNPGNDEIRLRPRDMAKIGLLYLNGGRWNGDQIVAKDWVEASMKPHLPSSWTAGYGYQWWIARFESPDEAMWVPSAVGNGGQRIFVVQPLNMVVVITAGNYNMGQVPLGSMTILAETVFPAAGIEGTKFVEAEE